MQSFLLGLRPVTLAITTSTSTGNSKGRHHGDITKTRADQAISDSPHHQAASRVGSGRTEDRDHDSDQAGQEVSLSARTKARPVAEGTFAWSHWHLHA